MERSNELWNEAVTGIDETFEVAEVDWGRISGFLDDSWTRERRLSAERTVEAEFECFFEGYPEPGQRLELARGEGQVHQEFELYVTESMPRDGFFRPRKADFDPTTKYYEIESRVEILETPNLLEVEWQVSDEKGEELAIFYDELIENLARPVELPLPGPQQQGPLNQPMNQVVLRQNSEGRMVSNSRTDLNPRTAIITNPKSVETDEGLEVLKRSVASLQISLDGLRSNAGR